MSSFDSIPSPCFVLEEEKFRSNLSLIQEVGKKSGADIILAFKGFAMWGAFPIYQAYFKGATASSLHEVMLANEHLDTKPHTYCVAYRDDEFDEIARRSSYITFNSVNQFLLFKESVPDGVSCGLRINPGWSDVETELYNPSSPASRLGISELKELPDGIEGLHFHVLCESSAESLVTVLEHVENKFGHFINQIKWVNMGGGHLMTRSGYDIDLLIRTIRDFKEKYQVKVILEPGSAFAWEAGFLKTTVLDVVENGGIKTAIIDASFTCHMPDCLEMPYQPIIRGASSNPDKSHHTYRIGGLSCLAGDFLGDYGFPSALKAGDQLIFEDMIHYTMVKSNMFNGIDHPSIGIWTNDDQFHLARKFTYLDYRDRLS